MGTMLDQAELRGEARGEARGEKRGMEKQRKLDEAELKAKVNEIMLLKAQLEEAKAKNR